jgi:formate dehydrogenase subunit beta
MKGEMYIARSTDKATTEKAECGGAVTALLKFALESKKAEAVVAVKAREGNRYDAVPVVITDPAELAETGGSLHCASPNIARFLKEYLDGAFNQKTVAVAKPCDAKAIIELAKRNQINLDNLTVIGLNCTGTLPPAKAKALFKEAFEADPADVVGEDIEDNELIISLKDGSQKKKDLAELEEKGQGRRENCRRCETNIPVMADIACGKWGTTDKNSTFIEVCSEKGAQFVEDAVAAGYIKVEQPTADAVTAREKKDRAAVELAQQWQEKDFAALEEMSRDEKFNYWSEQFSHCIKCYGCRDACPICYCKDCFLEADRGFVPPGEVPPNIMFPMVRITHVMDSCVNCGQCQDACAMEIPIARLIFMLSKKIGATFKYEPGMDASQMPPLRTITDQELTVEGVEITL